MSTTQPVWVDIRSSVEGSNGEFILTPFHRGNGASARILAQKALARCAEGLFDTAFANLNWALERGPDDPYILAARINIFIARSFYFYKQKQFELALRDLSKVESLDPQNPEIRMGRARIFLKRASQCYKERKLAQALLDINRVETLDPTNERIQKLKAAILHPSHKNTL